MPPNFDEVEKFLSLSGIKKKMVAATENERPALEPAISFLIICVAGDYIEDFTKQEVGRRAKNVMEKEGYAVIKGPDGIRPVEKELKKDCDPFKSAATYRKE